jgi:hypothetical protein
MNDNKILILYIFTVLLLTGCVKCYTLFNSEVAQGECLEINRISGVVNKDGQSGSVSLDINIQWCDSYGQNHCCQKKIKRDSLNARIKIGEHELTLTNKKESIYQFSSRSIKIFDQNDRAEIFVAYKVDSLGIELNRSNSYNLYRDKDCSYSVH